MEATLEKVGPQVVQMLNKMLLSEYVWFGSTYDIVPALLGGEKKFKIGQLGLFFLQYLRFSTTIFYAVDSHLLEEGKDRAQTLWSPFLRAVGWHRATALVRLLSL